MLVLIPILTERVIFLSFLRIAQHFIRFVDQLKLVLCVFVALVLSG